MEWGDELQMPGGEQRKGERERGRQRERQTEADREEGVEGGKRRSVFLAGGCGIRRPWAVLLEEFLAFSLCLGKLALCQERLACTEKVHGRVLEGRDREARQMLLVHEHLRCLLLVQQLECLLVEERATW